MHSPAICVLLLLLAFEGQGALPNNLPNEVQKILSRRNGIYSLEFIGTSSDGKSFFQDSNSKALRTWQGSRTFCEHVGLKQAKVTSRSQMEVLQSAYRAGKFSANLWIAARENRQPSMLVWDDTKRSLDMSVFQAFGDAIPEDQFEYQICGLVQPETGYIYLRPCNAYRVALCEIGLTVYK